MLVLQVVNADRGGHTNRLLASGEHARLLACARPYKWACRGVQGVAQECSVSGLM